jgi:hypothetical protein
LTGLCEQLAAEVADDLMPCRTRQVSRPHNVLDSPPRRCESMPRKPRVFIEGGIYHVYCRATRGEAGEEPWERQPLGHDRG